MKTIIITALATYTFVFVALEVLSLDEEKVFFPFLIIRVVMNKVLGPTFEKYYFQKTTKFIKNNFDKAKEMNRVDIIKTVMSEYITKHSSLDGEFGTGDGFHNFRLRGVRKAYHNFFPKAE